MYLKEIKANGFKSFADNISIELCEGTNGIVGPNGSGKSNVVDAVRWVLGEQSVKSLRGDGSMTDVIFSGSKSRKEAGSASVTLIFDNKDHYLKLDADIISIKRKLYKDGTNEYYFNNEKCRLKDVTNILLDNGIAKESFNIISQGKIEEILSNKPTERRIIFEEAAGVLKYKRRKEDALRKLEKTHYNITRADDIINELEIQVVPLKEQKEKAIKYLEIEEELKNIEIALITSDITKINELFLISKQKIEELNSEIMLLSNTNTTGIAKISKYKLEMAKLEEKINEKQKEFIILTTNVEKINGQKQIILERKNYEIENPKIHNNLIELKEKELKTKNNIDLIKRDLQDKERTLEQLNEKITEIETEINKIKNLKNDIELKLSNNIRENNSLKYKIENLNQTLENNSLLPTAVKEVLNSSLEGIHNIVGKLIEIEEKYSLAISTALGAVSNNVVVDNELNAKNIINYLKKNNLGRVTFFPLNVIKPKGVDYETHNLLKDFKGFIDIASNLVKYDKKYHNIILNQLGNVIVVDNIDNANIISKNINYRYKVTTLTGEIIHVGGSITGGKNIFTNDITIKYEINVLREKYKNNIDVIKDLENKINEFDYNLKSLEDKLYLNSKEKIGIAEFINTKNKELLDNENQLELTINSINGANSLVSNSLSEEENKIIEEYYSEVNKRDKVNSELTILINEKAKLSEELEEYEYNIRKDNSLFNAKNKELKNLEIEINRYDVKLDMLLNNLNENYNLTYEKAKEAYILELEENIAVNKVSLLKTELKDLGPVNLGAIDEYDRVSTRYEFLINQKEDLLKAENILLEIIEEMDAIMKKEFIKTFEIVRENFSKIFKELFKGGNADLKLSDPNNILETGIEIIALPPGKKLTTISLLSGGEKTFTAISLLFAILKSREVPFCILDEVEAALDEVNVVSFGEYINKLKGKTQFILITHKKKTMEYVDVLYGITMQESGVSKLVSVNLEEIESK